MKVKVVILCVCYRASCSIPCLYVENWVPIGFLCHSQHMYCVDFVENALFKSSGKICWSPLPYSLLDELSTEKRDNDGFLSRRLACRTSNGSYNLIDSSLATVQSFLALCVAWKTVDQACAWSCCILRNRVDLHMYILVVRLAQYHHTALAIGWIAHKCAEGFAQ